ncbi:MAG: hypothetical protein FD160_1449 [Caulobacteraceae bacterium]|nr:MAG: hypothetical protein FD160_1449 [Caulobacteraceae bacterium]
MPAIRLFLDHPGFFLHDPDIDLFPDDIPIFTERELPLVVRTDRVISVGTIADVDGDVELILDCGPDLQGVLVFGGGLPTPSGALVITQSSGAEVLRLSSLGPQTDILVGVDDVRFPSRVHILAR